MKGEDAVDYSTVTRWFKKFLSGCKNLNNLIALGRPETVDSETVLQAIEPHLVSSIWRVSGKLSISQSRVVHYFHNLSKSIQICRTVPHATRILQNFWLTLAFDLQVLFANQCIVTMCTNIVQYLCIFKNGTNAVFILMFQSFIFIYYHNVKMTHCIYLPNRLHRGNMWHKDNFLKQSLTSLNLKFSFS